MKLRFWEKEKPQEELVGASIKIATAERMKAAGRFQKVGNEEDDENQAFGQNVHMLIGYVMAILVAVMALDKSVINFSGFELTGSRSLDDLIFGSSVPNFFGDGDIDMIVAIMLKALLYCLIAAIFPIIGYGIRRVLGKEESSPYFCCWIAIVASPIIYVLFAQIIFPIFTGF